MFCTYKQMTFLSTIHLTCNLTLRAIWVRCVYLERSQFMIKQHSSFFLSLSFFFLSFFLSLSFSLFLLLFLCLLHTSNFGKLQTSRRSSGEIEREITLSISLSDSVTRIGQISPIGQISASLWVIFKSLN